MTDEKRMHPQEQGASEKQNERSSHEEVERFYKRLAEACVIQERAELEMEASKMPEPELSDAFYKSMNDLMRQMDEKCEADEAAKQTVKHEAAAELPKQSVHRGFRIRRMAAVAVAVCVIACIPLIAAASGLDFLQLFRHETDESVDVFNRIEDEAVIKDVYRITALPTGYEVVDQDINEVQISTIYGDVNDDSRPKIMLRQLVNFPAVRSTDNENIQESEIEVHGAIGTWYAEEIDNVLIWQQDDLYFELESELDIENLIEIANSVRKY